MIHAIQLLKMEAHARRSMSTPNQNTITEHTARENSTLAEEYELAAEALRQIHNGAFKEGWLQGLKNIADSCMARRNDKSEDA